MTEISRVVAAQILKNCVEDGKELAIAISNNSRYVKLQNNDKTFAMLLVNECLRHMGQLDVVIDKYLSNPERIPADVRYVLRVAATEHFFTESPDYAVVNNAVNAVAFLKKAKLKGLTNAVVRKICKKENLNDIDINNNFPGWLVESWIKQYGQDKAIAIMENSLKRYPLYISVKSEENMWADKLNAKVIMPNLLLCEDGMNIPNAEGFKKGEWWVQGFESSLPARLFSDLKGKKVLDCCAAPGGKTAQLANSGAKVFALEKNSRRIQKLNENIERLKLDVTVVEDDAVKYKAEKDFDAILIDAPCSATGTIRKNPDALYHKKPQHITDLAKTQKDILSNISKLLKVGGELVYATCSLQKAEGEDQIQNFLKENLDFELYPIKAEEIGGFASLINKDGMVRIIPQNVNEYIESDGFFIARIKRVK